jgi:MFS family permease
MVLSSVLLDVLSLNSFSYSLGHVRAQRYVHPNPFVLLHDFALTFVLAPIMIGVSIFFVGSVGCGWAQNMPMFLACRAVAGLGAGGLVSLAFIVIADIFPNGDTR